ncbi:hypothetical protein, partial [Acidithiobacillus sp.]|uniref:hypothetical protein n=1 Tax=Acidithiobacillus sp. TaxID=1872118 RepID=UPI003CFBFAF3
IPRLRRDLIAERYRRNADVRSQWVCEMLEQTPVSDLCHLGLRRANREIPSPPYEPFMVWLTPAAAAKIAQLPETISVSAIVQEFLCRDPDKPPY